MIGLIDYQLPEGTEESLAERSVFPHRGLLAVRIEVASVDEVAANAADFGAEIAVPAATVELGTLSLRTLTLRAPHGVLHQCFEAQHAS